MVCPLKSTTEYAYNIGNEECYYSGNSSFTSNSSAPAHFQKRGMPFFSGVITVSITIARYYTPEIGRWISRDPIGERGGINLSVILNNNSIIRFDYLGKSFCSYWCPDKCIESGIKEATSGIIKIMPHLYGDPDNMGEVYNAIDNILLAKDIADLIEAGYTGGPLRAALEAISGELNIGYGTVADAYKTVLEYVQGNAGGWAIYTKVKYKECQKEKCCFGICERLNWKEKESGWKRCGIGGMSAPPLIPEPIYSSFGDSADNAEACLASHMAEYR